MKRRRFGRWIATVVAAVMGLLAAYALIVWAEILPRLSEKDVANVALMRAMTRAVPIDENAFFDVWMLDYELDSGQFDEFARTELERVDAAVLSGIEQVGLFNGPKDRRDGLNDVQTGALCPNDESCLQHVASARTGVEELHREKRRYLARVKTALSKSSLRIPFVARLNTPIPSNVVGKAIRSMQTALAYEYVSGERLRATVGACRLGTQLRAWRRSSDSLLLSMSIESGMRDTMALYIDMLRRLPFEEHPSEPCEAWVTLDQAEYQRCDIWRREFEWSAATADVATSPALREKFSARVIADWSTNQRHLEAKLARPFAAFCNADVSIFFAEQRFMTEDDLGGEWRCGLGEQAFNPTGCFLIDQATGMPWSKYFNRSFDLDAQLLITRAMEARFLDATGISGDPDLTRIGLRGTHEPRLSSILRAIQIPIRSDNSTWSLPIDRVFVPDDQKQQ
jgi:hypothetical protein